MSEPQTFEEWYDDQWALLRRLAPPENLALIDSVRGLVKSMAIEANKFGVSSQQAEIERLHGEYLKAVGDRNTELLANQFKFARYEAVVEAARKRHHPINRLNEWCQCAACEDLDNAVAALAAVEKPA